jgi:hypothetical protein
LCADADCIGAPALKVVQEYGYTLHVKVRGQEASEFKRDPANRAKRWVKDVAHFPFCEVTNGWTLIKVALSKSPCQLAGITRVL